jgi:hypothetical protein
MKIAGIALLSALALVGLAACQKAADQDVKDKLSSIDKRLSSIEEAIKRGPPPGAARPTPEAPPRPQGPDPSKVYSVEVGDSPFRGAQHAKVTIVEASTFT